LRLYEERFIELFYIAMGPSSVASWAMGLIVDLGIIQTVPICEIEAITAWTILVFSSIFEIVRAGATVEITKQEPYIIWCIETTTRCR
jgi:hypothetical protein